ncbi:MAG: hypothetical protein ABI835_11210 [Chloroflexota bacterium]
MISYLRNQLRKLTKRWRDTVQSTRTVTETTEDSLLKGHIQGVRDGLLIAAGDVDKLLDEP